MEEGRPSKEESIQNKKSKSATGLKIQEDKDTQMEMENVSKDIGKDNSEMETEESGGEESWKEEDVGEEEGEAGDVSNQDSPTCSVSLVNVDSQPREKEDDKINEEKDMDFEQEKNELEQEKDKENPSKDKEFAREGLILDNLKNLSDIRMGFDKWTYEGIKNLEKSGKHWEEERKKDERDWKQRMKDLEEKAKKMEA
ncbi:uncharacterized protein LOC131876145 [Cryptomeria japonica]|uniref:uncharacterized protein LOC131876145 n=1 Tax=Cryptomeria japonica TaxID=3369 RepID=UPI0027D9D44D|nr:uncharacterized protein LOC131876145 [Cryptomeria japonica]